jgi:putative ABC transport system permease protein
VASGGVGQVKERSQGGRGLAVLDTMTQNLRYAWRSLRRRPGLVAGVSVTLALGLGANAAMFGVLDRLLLRPPPYLRDPATVNRVYFTRQLPPGDLRAAAINGLHVAMPYQRYRDLTQWTTAFAQTATFATNFDLAVGAAEGTRQVRVAAVSASFFSFFDAPPVIGRYFTAQEDVCPKGADVVVLGYDFWRSQYGSRRDVVGTRLRTELGDYTVIGVAPEDFVGVGQTDESYQHPTSGYGEPVGVFIPVTTFGAAAFGDSKTGPCTLPAYSRDWLQMIVRRRPGVSLTNASSDLTSAFQRSYLAQRDEVSAQPFPEWERYFPPIAFARPHAIAGPVLAARGPLESSTSRVATWVAAVAVIVLLIGCANVSNLLLANARDRQSEIALRLALGVSRRRLAGQLLTECLLLAAIGGIAALAVARLSGAILTSMFLPGDANVLLFQSRTLLFGAATTILAGLMVGLVPALQARHTDVIGALKGAGRGSTSDRSRIRAVLLVLQGALSVVLLVGAGLFVRSLEHVRDVHLGFDIDRTLRVSVSPWQGTRLDPATQRVLAQRMVEVAQSTPGVTNAARAIGGPMVGAGNAPLFVPGLGSVDHLGDFGVVAASPEYFQTIGTRIVRGRGFTSEDDAAKAPRVAVVSDTMAQMLWPGQDAIGKRMQIGSDTAAYTTVVGIAENTIDNAISGKRPITYYVPIEQIWYDVGAVEVFVRTRGSARQYESTIQRVLQDLVPGTAYLALMRMREVLDPRVQPWEIGAVLFFAFGALALIVAAVGLYSVISYDVARRTRELGIRIALGAKTHHVLRAVATESALFAAIGVLLGGATAFLAGPHLAPLLFAESPRDPVVFAAVVATLAMAVLAATIGPALRASHVDPGTALRTE